MQQPSLPCLIPSTRLTFAIIVAALTSGFVHLSASHAEELQITRSAKLGAVTFVRGQDGGPINLPPQPGAPMAAALTPAEQFFATFGGQIGISDPATQLKQTRVETDWLNWTHTTFQQVFAGVPVFSGILKVHVDADGRVMSVNGRYYPISEKLNVTPAISLIEAEMAAMNAVDSVQPGIDSSELVIVDPGWYGDRPVGPRLAYHIVVIDDSFQIREGFFIDAATSEVLDRWSMIHDLKDRRIHNGQGTGSLPGIVARTEGDPAVGAPLDVNRAYDYYGDTYDFFFRAFGRDSIDNNGLTMIATVNSTAPSCPNAFWNGVQMVFCNGLVTDDVVGHELTHGVTQYTANLIYQNQPGQLNESYSDIFGEMIDLFNGDAAFAGAPGGTPWPAHPTGPGLDVPNNLRGAGCSQKADGFPDGVRWLIGEDINVIASIIRDMWNPPCRNHPDRANSPLQTCPANDSGGVHSGSGVPNHAFAIMTDGKTFNGYTVNGIGPIKAGAIWYRALTVYLSPASEFMDAYDGIRQSAQDLVGFDPNDPRTGLPSGNPITAADVEEVEKALLATEMNTEGACGQFDRVLDHAPAFECGNRTILFSDDFESGNAGWTVSNSAPPTPYDWVLAGSLPLNRPGTAWFCANPSIGDCGSQDESALHSLFSPVVNLPAELTAPYASFTHFIWTEGGWDTGNVKISVNGGDWNLIPRSAYKFNGYNGQTNTVGQGNTNPLAGEHAWTGVGGRWGTSVINLSGLAGNGDAIRFRFDFGKDGCTGVTGWYVDDFGVYDCLDCDAQNGADINDLHFADVSTFMGPIGAGSPQAHTIIAPPVADDDVILTVNARGDFSAASENVSVIINGNSIAQMLVLQAGDCPSTPEYERLVIPAAVWNAAVNGGDAVITFSATADVTASGSCGGLSYIGVSVRFTPAGAVDCNANASPDHCDRQLGGVMGFVDALLGIAPFDCVYDLHVDGVLDGQDVQPFVDDYLGT